MTKAKTVQRNNEAPCRISRSEGRNGNRRGSLRNAKEVRLEARQFCDDEAGYCRVRGANCAPVHCTEQARDRLHRIRLENDCFCDNTVRETAYGEAYDLVQPLPR